MYKWREGGNEISGDRLGFLILLGNLVPANRPKQQYKWTPFLPEATEKRRLGIYTAGSSEPIAVLPWTGPFSFQPFGVREGQFPDCDRGWLTFLLSFPLESFCFYQIWLEFPGIYIPYRSGSLSLTCQRVKWKVSICKHYSIQIPREDCISLLKIVV